MMIELGDAWWFEMVLGNNHGWMTVCAISEGAVFHETYGEAKLGRNWST